MKKTLQASEFRFKYGLLGAGAVSNSLIGSLRQKERTLGPVSGVSYRVASRIANTLRAGYPVRTSEGLDEVPVILFHSPPEQTEILLKLLDNAEIAWKGKSLIVCDCEIGAAATQVFQHKGARVARACRFEVAGHLLVEGAGAALIEAQRIARGLRLKTIEITAGKSDVFDAAVALGGAALTPLIDSAATLLREAGVRDADAPRLAVAIFQQTAREYARSGKQSWAWYMKKPDEARVEAQIVAAGGRIGPVLRELLQFGLTRTQATD